MRRRLAPLLLAPLLGLTLLAGCTDPPGPGPSPAPSTAPAPSAAAPSSGAAPAAGTTIFGAHWDWNRYQQQEPFLRKLAGSSTYYELSWCDVEKQQGAPDWATLDSIARRSRDLGITLDLKIRVGTCWATGGAAKFTRGQANKTESAMPRDLAQYTAFVTALVRRYRPLGVTRYAVENEVNAQQYWAGTPQQYTRLVTAAAGAIRAADPAARVADSGISSVAMGMGVADRLLEAGQDAAAVTAYNGYFARRIGTRGKQIPPVTDAAALRTALANPVNRRNLDYLAVTERLVADRTVQIRQLHFYEHPDGVTPLLDYLKATTAAGVPVEAWEVGRFDKTGDADPAAVADEMTRVAAGLAAGGIRKIIWLPLAYNPGNRAGAEVRYGLLGPDGTERPAGTAMAALADAARGRTARPVTTGTVQGVGFTGPTGTRLIVWSTGAAVPLPRSRLSARELDTTATPTAIGAAPLLIEAPGSFDATVAALRS